MTKLIHTADIHLGVKLSGLGKAGDKVRAAAKQSLSDMITAAVDEKVDAFLIAGDLFESNSVSYSLMKFALSEIERLGDIPCLILPGTHDCLEPGSIYLTLEDSDRPDNLYIFDDPDNPVIEIEKLNVKFYGAPNVSARSRSNPIKAVRPDDSDLKHVLLAHGSYMIPGKTQDDDHPFSLDDIDNSGFDYIALGHWHSYFELPTKNTKAAYCGAPETIAFDQTGAGHYAIVTLDDNVTLEKRKVGRTSWNEIELSAENFRYTIEIERELQKYIGVNNIIRAKLTGLASAENIVSIDEIIKNNAEKFLHLSIVDATETVPGNLREMKIPPTTILGQFIAQMSDAIESNEDPDEKELLNESLRTGFAMLSGKDVL
jgi:exonuclease SbcD